MDDVQCLVLEDDSLASKLHKKNVHYSQEESPSMSCRHVGVGGKQMLIIKVTNNQKKPLHVSQIRVGLIDPHQAQVDLDHPDQDSKDTFEIDSMEDLDEENYGNLRIEAPHSGFPFSLQPLETYSALFKVHVKESLEYNFTMEVDLQATLVSSLGTSSHICLTNYRLISLRIRKPGMVITSIAEEPPCSNKSFNVRYTITNYLQDFLNIKLTWNPEKALKDPKAQKNKVYHNAVLKVRDSVICRQAVTNLGALKLGSSVSMLVAFHICQPGLYELGQHMKINLQYSLGNPTETPLTTRLHLHQRRGSNTSTQSMPLENQGTEISRQGSKSATMSPVTLTPGVTSLMNAENKKGSNASLHNLLSSPSRVFPRGLVSPSPTLSRPRIGIFSSTLSRTPSNASITSLARCPAPVNSLQVLKHNCQVFVEALAT